MDQRDRADLAAADAKANEAKATANQKLASEREKLARDANLLSQHRFYAAEMKLAEHDWHEGRIDLLRHRLRGQEPKDASVADLRGFEWHHLRRLCHLELRTFAGHTGGIWSLAFSPDGHWIASVANEGWSSASEVKFWNVCTGEASVYLRWQKPVYAVAFSPDCNWLACGGGELGKGGTVELWDVGTKQKRLTLTDHTDTVYCIAFSPDGRRFATGSEDGTVRICELSTGEARLILRGGGFRGVAFSPDGRFVVGMKSKEYE